MKGTEANSFAFSMNFVSSEDHFTEAKFSDDPTRNSLFEALLTSQSNKEKPFLLNQLFNELVCNFLSLRNKDQR